MKNSFLQEIVVSVVLIVLLVLFLNPFDFWMPPMLLMTMVLSLVVLFSLFVSFIWRENSKDEREGLHKMMADRIAFLAGTLVLVIAIIVKSLRHEPCAWLVATLVIMILAKIIGLLYSQIKY